LRFITFSAIQPAMMPMMIQPIMPTPLMGFPFPG